MSREADDRDLATRLRERAVVRAYRASTWALERAPERLSGGVGGVLAESTYLAWPARRRATRESLARVLGTTPDDPRVDRLGRRTYRNYARYVVDLMRLPGMAPHELASRVDMSAAVVVDELRDQGRGVILVAAHLGHNEAGAAAVADRGWTVCVAADDTGFRELFALLKEQRERWGVRLIPWTSLRELYSALKRREMVGLLVDWGYRPDGVPVRLFGEWTTLPAGPAILAARTGSVILPVAIRMLPAGRYVATAATPIDVTSVEPGEIARATQAVADALERSIRANPGQWWVFKSMWPTTPDERTELLARLPEYGLTPEGA